MGVEFYELYCHAYVKYQIYILYTT
jgi:hypothetical protein